MAASKKDYVAIARIIRAEILVTEPMVGMAGVNARCRLYQVAQNIADHFSTNSEFNRKRFLDACGVH
jgi:hypothetical protein